MVAVFPFLILMEGPMLMPLDLPDLPDDLPSPLLERERLRLTFTNIDPADPMRAFSFQVFVDGGDQYHVESCEPAVSGLDELIDALNTGNDFSAFVLNMRKRFKALVA